MKISPCLWKPGLLLWDEKVHGYPWQRSLKELRWPTATGTYLVSVPKPRTLHFQQTWTVGQTFRPLSEVAWYNETPKCNPKMKLVSPLSLDKAKSLLLGDPWVVQIIPSYCLIPLLFFSAFNVAGLQKWLSQGLPPRHGFGQLRK